MTVIDYVNLTVLSLAFFNAGLLVIVGGIFAITILFADWLDDLHRRTLLALVFFTGPNIIAMAILKFAQWSITT